jgi:tetratricopeptide (TPR) repeat protein
MARSSQDPELQAELAEAFRQLGDLQGSPYSQNLGDTKGALASLSRARSIAEAGLSQHPRDPAWLHLAGIAESTTAEVDFGSSQTAPAIAHASKAVQYYESMAPLTKNPVWLTDAAANYGVLGDMMGQTGTQALADPARAAANYRRSIEFDQKALAMPATIPVDPGTAHARRGIVVMRMKLADLIRMADPEEALKQLREATAAFGTFPPDERKRPGNKRIEAMLLRKTGNTLKDLQQWTAAAETLDRALVYHEAEYSADRMDQRAATDLYVILGDLTDLYLYAQDNEKALAPAERCFLLAAELLRKEPGNPVSQLSAAWAQSRFARILVRTGNATRALPLATEAMKELARLSSAPTAAPRDLQLAAEAYTEIEPKSLRDAPRAVALARRYLAATGPENILGLYTLALALQEAGQTAEAKSAAQKTLALLAPVRGGVVPYTRKRLEAIQR